MLHIAVVYLLPILLVSVDPYGFLTASTQISFFVLVPSIWALVLLGGAFKSYLNKTNKVKKYLISLAGVLLAPLLVVLYLYLGHVWYMHQHFGEWDFSNPIE